MAPVPRLKQSSLKSFLAPKPPPDPISNHPIPASASASTVASAAAAAVASPPLVPDYEQSRLENIRRNRHFLEKLGISTPTTSKPLPPKCRPKPPPPAPSAPLRRSSRKRGAPPPSSPDEQEPSPPPQDIDIDFTDSYVFRYACDASPIPDPVPSSASHPTPGFTIVGKPLRDRSLTKIYSMDVQFLTEGRFLVAAGGHGGFISVYGGEGTVGEDDCYGPLMSWKGSRSWVSGVNFLEDNPMLLVSSSNDGRIVVWDVKKQTALLSASWSPPIVAEGRGMHSGGIFSMDRLGCSIATTSKDSTVGVSRVTADGELVAERSFSGHHYGVIRGISFRNEKDILADCGADGRICVLDTRLPQPCTLTIESQHSTGVNTVQWRKTDEFLLVSASKDPTLLLYDIRNTAEPLHKLQGHVQSNTAICHHIYRPSFVDGGKSIATPGQGSRKISLYNTDTGTLISQGVIGYDANLVFFTRGREAHPRLWTAGRQIDQLCPLLKP